MTAGLAVRAIAYSKPGCVAACDALAAPCAPEQRPVASVIWVCELINCLFLFPWPWCSGGWVREFESAANKLSYTDGSKSSGEPWAPCVSRVASSIACGGFQ